MKSIYQMAVDAGIPPDTIYKRIQRGMSLEDALARVRPRDIHGTAGKYNSGCRCAECKKAHRDKQRADRARRSPDNPQCPHGTQGGYINWNCRCEACTKANTEACNKRNRKLKEITK